MDTELHALLRDEATADRRHQLRLIEYRRRIALLEDEKDIACRMLEMLGTERDALKAENERLAAYMGAVLSATARPR